LIVDGKLDDVPEQAFYMVGSIDEVLGRTKKAGLGEKVSVEPVQPSA